MNLLFEKNKKIWQVQIRKGINECTKAELAFIDDVYENSITGVNWWQLLDNSYTGVKYCNYHFFFYKESKNKKPCAHFSAQYIPDISILPYVADTNALVNLIAKSGFVDYKLKCLIIHSLSSVASVYFKDNETEIFLYNMDYALNLFRSKHPINIILVRGLTENSVNSIKQYINNKTWNIMPGFPSNFCKLDGVSTFEEYLNKFKSHRRQRFRASLKKIENNSRIKVLRICAKNELEPFLTQVLEIKQQTALRNEDELSIPVYEKPEFFNNCLNMFKEKSFLYVIHDNENVVYGYFLGILSGNFARGISLGVRHPEGKKIDAWFNLIFLLIKSMIKNKVELLNLGNGNDEIKQKIGALKKEHYSAISFYPLPLRYIAEKFLLPRLKRL